MKNYINKKFKDLEKKILNKFKNSIKDGAGGGGGYLLEY